MPQRYIKRNYPQRVLAFFFLNPELFFKTPIFCKAERSRSMVRLAHRQVFDICLPLHFKKTPNNLTFAFKWVVVQRVVYVRSCAKT